MGKDAGDRFGHKRISDADFTEKFIWKPHCLPCAFSPPTREDRAIETRVCVVPANEGRARKIKTDDDCTNKIPSGKETNVV